MMQTLELLWLAKSSSQDEAMLNSQEIKPVASAIIELCLAKGISWSVSWLFSQSICRNSVRPDLHNF